MNNESIYPETADIETASEDYAQRFAGSVGEWMLKVQELIVLSWIKTLRTGSTVLDVGGGHGQLAVPLAKAGYNVTVLGSSDECAERIQPEIDAGRIMFHTGNVIDLPFPDRSFDVVLSIRLLPHCKMWPVLIKEMCRVTRKSVIVDYPVKRGLNSLSGAFFGLKKKIEGNTRPYALFKDSEIVNEFGKNHFGLKSRQPQFCVPMAFHRLLQCSAMSSGLESFCGAVGLTHLFGSPMLAEFRPQLDVYNKDLR